MKKYLLSATVIFAFLFYSTLATKNTPPPSPLISQIIPTDSPTNPPVATAPPKRNTPVPTNRPAATATPQSGRYKNGTYTGSVADAFYGNIQVAAVIHNGQLASVNILQYPNDRNRSIEINSQALPILQSEAIQAQNASVNMVSGATDSSAAFIQSLTSALSQAIN